MEKSVKDNAGFPFANAHCQKFMAASEAEKISKNLDFLTERTKNLEQLIDTLIANHLLDKNDLKRIMSRAKYDQNLYMYLTVIQNGRNRFKEFLQLLCETGNIAAARKLQEPTINFSDAAEGFLRHWPFTMFVLCMQIFGFWHVFTKLCF